MSLSKLKKIHVIIIGVLLCIITCVAIYYLMIVPQNDAYKKADDRYNAAIGEGTEQVLAQTRKKYQETLKQYAQVMRDLDAQMRIRMPNLSFARRDYGMIALWKEQLLNLGPLLESFANKGSAKVLDLDMKIPEPPKSPNDPVFDKDVLVFDLGEIKVQGDYKTVLDSVGYWNGCPRLVLTSMPELSGVSPAITAKYNLKCYIFPREKGGPAIPIAGGGAEQ